MDSDDNRKYILSGSPTNTDFLNGSESLGEFIIQRFENNRNKILLINALTAEKLTASEILKKSILVAKCLQKYGIKRGDKVGICCENRFEFYYLLFGTIFLGATLTPFNTTYTERELLHAVNLSKPSVVFVSSFITNVFHSIKRDNSYMKDVIVFDDNNVDLGFENTFNYFIKKYNVTGNDESSFKCDPENVHVNICLILCSSGTTGLPKGVQLTHFNVLMTIGQQFERDRTFEKQLCPDPVVLSVIPLFHAYGCIMTMAMLCYYNTIVFLPKFEEKQFLKTIQQYRVNTALLVPPLMVFLAKNPIVDNYDLSSLKLAWCGAASLTRETQDAVYKRIGLKHIRQGYGMSEGSMAFTSQTDIHNKWGGVGVLRNGVKSKVICTETGRILGPYKPGELLFQSNTIMKGYINDEEATNNTIDKDGWIHTGDVGYYDDDGEFFIVERIKELIKYKGFQVAPAEIESILLQHSNIADAAVIGLPDELAGELPLAFVVRKSNVKLNEKEIIDFVASNVSYAKRLHGGVIFIDEIPKNASGKILRRKLRELLKNFKSKL